MKSTSETEVKTEKPEISGRESGWGRRHFLATMAAGAATAASADGLVQATETFASAMGQWRQQTFAALRGDTFEIVDERGHRNRIRLAEVNALEVRGKSGGGREPFSVIFQGGDERIRRQATYTVSHPHLGRFQLLMVPVDASRPGVRLEAVFA